MPMDPPPAWNDALANLKPTKGPDWAKAYADAIDKCVSNKAELTGIIGKPTFTFNKAVFAAQLMSLSYVQNANLGAMQFANAWEAAMMASTMVVAPGAALGSPSPATLWSVVFSSIIDPPSIAAGKAHLISMLPNIPPASDAKKSKVGEVYRAAFALCTCTINGLNSLPPPPGGPGPLPLIAPMVPFQ